MKNSIKIWFLIIGTIIFTAVFWKQSIGINSLIFTIFLIISLILMFPKSIKSKYAIIVYAGTLLSSLLIFYHASALSVFVWIISLFSLQAVVQYSKLKTILFSGLSGFVEYLTSFMLLKENINKSNKTSKSSKKIFKILRFIIIPIIAFFIFYWLYKFAVPEFDKLTNTFFGRINTWFSRIFEDISFNVVFIAIWGFITMGWYFYKRKKNTVVPMESQFTENIQRKRGKEIFNIITQRGLKPLLKFENTIALILIISVNVLLLTVNILDISTIWFGFEYTESFDLKQFVHEGTYLLIFSILLSMGIMLFYFRANINFYRKNKALKISAYIWIFQNLILLASVIIRNLHYIEHFALAYLRIGLFFFLSMVIIGLITLFLKIKYNKSLFYLLKVNSWALYIGFVIFAIPDWDTQIAKYNLNHYPDAFVEASYMLTLDEKTYPLIEKNKIILQQSDSLNTYRYYPDDYNVVFEQKISKFLEKYPKRTWLSWNYADYKAYEYFRK